MLFQVLVLLSLQFSQYVMSLNIAALPDQAGEGFTIPARRLRAAKRDDKLGRRDIKGCLRYGHELHYLDADRIRSEPQFGARLGIDFKTPTLLLEDIEHHVESITCDANGILLIFNSADAFAHAHAEFTSAEGFLLVTSHEGCNGDGERDPHIVSETAVNYDDQIIILSTSRVPWKHTFDSMKLDFGETNELLHPRHHGGLQSRQAAASSAVTGAAASSTSPAYPAAPSSTPTNINVTDSIDHSYIGTNILPPDQSLGPMSVGGPKLSAGINVQCKNCTFHGSINLVAGSISMGPFTSNTTQGFINRTEAIYDYIDDGFVEFRANRLGAHIELDTIIEATDKLTNWSVPLPPLPITPLLIPGIASVGPEFQPTLTAGFQLQAKLGFSTGFEVVVPDNSSLVLNLAERNGSSQQGFDETSVTSLPFQAETPSVELTFSAGFSPRLLLGIDFFEGSAFAGAGFFLNMPSLTATLSTVSHVDSKCENATSSTAKNAIHEALTHIDASVEVGLGVIAQAGVRFLGSDKLQDEATYEVLGKSFDLPTGCIGFDAKAKTYGIPAATGTSIGSASATASPTKTSGSDSLSGVRDAGFGGGRLSMALSALSAVGAVFLLF